MRDTVIVIPVLNPDEKFRAMLDELIQNGFHRFVVVNDGSDPDRLCFFEEAAARGAVVLTHAVNQGKGRALKTAFHYIREQYGADVQAVCIDADGQHRTPDIIAVAERLAAEPDKLVLGCRNFDLTGVPLRSRLGNKLTRLVFRLFSGIRVTDTQTGLRGLSGGTMEKFLPSKGERFEYEMNMLMDARGLGVSIAEVPISTVYIEENASSHFNPFLDSIRIYLIFAKFALSSLIAFLVDYLLFGLFSVLLEPLSRSTLPVWLVSGSLDILLATVFARVISSFVNYSLNRSKVFRSEENSRRTLVRYYLLCAVQMLASAFLVAFFTGLHDNAMLIKLPVDLGLFLISFQIQRRWVFARRKRPNDPPANG